MTSRALLVMAKQPVPGRTKTRLSPPLSAARAAELYACLLRDTLDSVRAAASQLPITPFIAYYPQQAEAHFRTLAPDFELIAQEGQNLNERLAGVLLAVQALGYDQVAAINSDSPSLPPAYLCGAFRELDKRGVDAVFGPSDDGGYYLIGWQRPYPHLVRDVAMSTPDVLSDTLDIARRDGLRISLLPPWYDVDTADDLVRLRANGHAGPHTKAFFAE